MVPMFDSLIAIGFFATNLPTMCAYTRAQTNLVEFEQWIERMNLQMQFK